MSVRICKKDISDKQLQKILNDCYVKGIKTDYGPGEEFYACAETNTSVYVPLAYYKTHFGIPKQGEFSKIKYKINKEYGFRTDGGRDQEKVFNDSVNILKKERSLLLSLFCGYGKCLGKNTPVILFDGSVKKVQNIKQGDMLLGDDSTPRTVFNLNKGYEIMYKIVDPFGEFYRVNEHHILSLYDTRNDTVIDIPVNVYNFLSKSRQKELYGIRTSVEFTDSQRNLTDSNENTKEPLTTEQLEMYEPLHFEWVLFKSKKTRLQVFERLLKKNPILWFDTDAKVTKCLFLARSIGYLAIQNGRRVELLYDNPNEYNIFPIRVEKEGYGEYFGFNLDGNGRFLLGDFTITHNTFTGIRLSQKIGFKCAILAHRAILIEQWETSIQKFMKNAVIQKVDTDGILDPDADFYIFNLAFVHKYWDKSTKMWKRKKVGCYKNIGTLIVDEAHVACASEMSRALLYFSPQVSIALTATPQRKDGLDKILELYFGDYNITRIIRIAQNPFTVYRYPTGIKPEFKLNAMGKKDWNSVIQSLIENQDRNEIIIKLIKKYPEYNILVLTKRTIHCKILASMLKGICSCTIMVGTDKKYDKTARVLLSTYSKLGVGFDDERLNMLIVACSVTDIEQYAGRLRDGPNKERLIIDLIDDDSSCVKHWQERRKWYISRNGNIQNYKKEKPTQEEKQEIEKYVRLAF